MVGDAGWILIFRPQSREGIRSLSCYRSYELVGFVLHSRN